ncbi:MAG: D-alanine--D-alanine ligase [Cryomorphaceae bacterium]|nr:D-alanine--D-alanine ligase [Cryomorphaceae bacterium]
MKGILLHLIKRDVVSWRFQISWPRYKECSTACQPRHVKMHCRFLTNSLCIAPTSHKEKNGMNSMTMKRKIAVLAGGYSGESIISERSANMVMNNIDRSLFDPILIRIYQDGWHAVVDGVNIPVDKANLSVMIHGVQFIPDAAFIMIHGTPGEDGILQGYLDMIGIPYTTGGVLNMALTFNKGLTTLALRSFNIPVAKSRILTAKNSPSNSALIDEIGLPCFVKPNRGGSSLGTSRVNNADELAPAIKKAFAVDGEVLIESFLEGTEVTCGVIPWDNDILALPATEIVSENEFFDFEAKYEGKSNEITPARIDDDTMAKVKKISEDIYRLMDCGGMIRVDFMIVRGVPHVIEINTVPGFSEASIIPQQAAVQGINKTFLISTLLNHL